MNTGAPSPRDQDGLPPPFLPKPQKPPRGLPDLAVGTPPGPPSLPEEGKISLSTSLSKLMGPASASPQIAAFKCSGSHPSTCLGLDYSIRARGCHPGTDRHLCRACSGPGDLPSPMGCAPPTSHNQGYQWLKDKILSEEGRRQQAKLKELQAIAERLGCTLPQLAIGKRAGGQGRTRVPRKISRIPECLGHPLHQPAMGNALPYSWGGDEGVPEHLGHLSTGGSWCQHC